MYTVYGGGAKNADDKVLQFNGAGKLVVTEFQVDNSGKLVRSCGNCSTQYKRTIIINDARRFWGSGREVEDASNASGPDPRRSGACACHVTRNRGCRGGRVRGVRLSRYRTTANEGLNCVLIAALTAVQRETPHTLPGLTAATASTLGFTPDVLGPATGAVLVELLDVRLVLAVLGVLWLTSAVPLLQSAARPSRTAARSPSDASPA